MQLQKGQRAKLQDIGIGSKFNVECNIISSSTIDITCFGVDENNKLSDDRYMVFYNQKASPNNEIKFFQNANNSNFEVNLDTIPSQIVKLVFTAAIDGNGTMRDISQLDFNIFGNNFILSGTDFSQEKAIIISEIYKKDGVWRINSVGQGFNGGLEALLNYFGGTSAEASQSTPPIVATSASQITSVDMKKKVFLEKRVNLEKNLQQTAPKLLDLSKKAAVSLEKRGLGEHRAKVALCLDISASMASHYSNGSIQEFAERILALACRLDDDGSIDIFLFGEDGYTPAPLTVKDFTGYIGRMQKEYKLEYDTRYSTAMELVRKHYIKPYKYERTEPYATDIPVYVMFLTDGQPSDKMPSTKAMKNAAYEPIFWQFMGIGNADMSYLERLDDLTGRYIDNADFFRVNNVRTMSDDVLYDKLMNEYPKWLQQAKVKGLIKE
jgi:stress response protein SCP2/uncharacterized protein YegL